MSNPPYILKQSLICKGGIWLIEIIFQNNEDARKFFRHLQPNMSAFVQSSNDIFFSEEQNIVKINIDPDNHNSLQLIKDVFYRFIIESKRDDWFRKILAESYYFKDVEEQQQILEIIHSILEGNREDLAAFVSDIDLDGDLKTIINHFFKNEISFSFDSFIKFRIRPLLAQMAKYAEISIDEYKMEQEYQMFIQTLRDFLQGRKAIFSHIHLLIDDGIRFFDEQFCEIKRTKLTQMIDRKLLFNHPVYVDSVTIAPLLSISPNSIYLYTDDNEQPLIRTIQNIFEERLVLGTTSQFFDNRHHFLTFTADEKI